MQLTKEQTLSILINNKKFSSNKYRFCFKTKTKWKCIDCGCTIYVSYRQFSRNSIFCKDCVNINQTPTTKNNLQYFYVKKLKDVQMNIVENMLKVNDDFFEKNILTIKV